jgi:hypothetical protein
VFLIFFPIREKLILPVLGRIFCLRVLHKLTENLLHLGIPTAMRRHIYLLVAIVICFINTAFAQQPYFTYETKAKGENLSFPVFSSKDNAKAAKNISRLLQLSELNVLDGYYKNDIFEYVSPPEMAASFDIRFDIKENSPGLLSVRFDISSCGMTCYYWSKCYNFNPQTGEPIQLGDLFTPQGLESFNEQLNVSWAAQIDAGVKDDPANEIEVVQEFKNCFEDGYTMLESFYAGGNTLVIDAENCLPKFAKFYDIDTQVRFGVKELIPLLSNYGKSVLGISGTPVKNFKSEYVIKELKIYTNKDKNIVLGIVQKNNITTGYFADTKIGIYAYANSSDTTSMTYETEENETYTITTKFTGSEVTVTCRDKEGTVLPPVVLVRE